MQPHLPSTGYGLFNPELESSACGVGFITRKDGRQTHEVIAKGHEALCAIPHRGGMSSEGVGDGAGVSIDLSQEFFSTLTGQDLRPGLFGVGNFFMPDDPTQIERAKELITGALEHRGLVLLTVRDVPVDNSKIRELAVQYQLPIIQWIFAAPSGWVRPQMDAATNAALLDIEKIAYNSPELRGLYPVSVSARTQVLKGRLNSGEVIGYFTDLTDERHKVRTLFFHTRFSTNTEPHPSMAQPFRMMAHNGELNTDRKNRLAESALASARRRTITRPPGQSDSSRLDQTLQSRVFDDDLELVEAVVSMMPPAWENDDSLPAEVRAMFEYFSLYEEKNDGPAALIFSDGDIIGARLDRLGLRPLRTLETEDYLVVSSEAGQIHFDPTTVIRRGRIEAGGMLYFDHREGRRYTTAEAVQKLAAQRDYAALLAEARVNVSDITPPDIKRHTNTLGYDGDLTPAGRYVAYSLNQESFRFMMDPMLATGGERISAMGYGNAINALSDQEGGMAKYFSQRFAQVTNPPLDSIREANSMSLRVSLGAKPHGGRSTKQIVVKSPILSHLDMVVLREQQDVPVERFSMLYAPRLDDDAANAEALQDAVERLCDQVEQFARTRGGIAIISDRNVSSKAAPLPLILAVAALNQRLITSGVRLQVSLVLESGQLPSSHHIAAALGFGASAVYSISARLRAEEKYPSAPAPAGEITETDRAFAKFAKAAEKSLMKTMGRVGLCTVESYIGGEFFEPNYLDTTDGVLARYFPHLDSPVAGVGFDRIAQGVADWHRRACELTSDSEIPLLGLFKERAEGAGHSYGMSAVRGFTAMTEESLALPHTGHQRPGAKATDDAFSPETHQLRADLQQRVGLGPSADDSVAIKEQIEDNPALRLLTLRQLEDAFGLDDQAYVNSGYSELTPEQIDEFGITPGYRDFVAATNSERAKRPAALRDVLALPADIRFLATAEQFRRELGRYAIDGQVSIVVRGLEIERVGVTDEIDEGPDSPQGPTVEFNITLTEPTTDHDAVSFTRVDPVERHRNFADFLTQGFGDAIDHAGAIPTDSGATLRVRAHGRAAQFLSLICPGIASLQLEEVQPAHEITPTLASGAMSHGALVASAHEAVAHGVNMVGGMSNCGEGGEHMTRYGTIRGSRIKQFASGRFGIWAGYLADPMLQELEIKIGQGAKPGEGGQLPAPKVTVEIAAARGGTPGVELVSPPPHHDTYSIEDLAQLIHDCKAARVRVIVKLVSSEGIGTIAVGVAKAGADVINVAGNTGGTGAAAVTSLKYAGRSAEIGVSEVHQALLVNGLRDKVILRCSGAHQTASDVVTSALLGGDSFEFGTTALMMLKCVMAKNCNIKCPAGLTTNPEVFDGDPRALAQYLLNISHEVREILAFLGLRSLREARGRTDLLQLLDHPSAVGSLDVRRLLAQVPEKLVADPIYLEKNFAIDDALITRIRQALVDGLEESVTIADVQMANQFKTVGGQTAIDIERMLNHELSPEVVKNLPSVRIDDRGRASLKSGSVKVSTFGSAGQSYGAFNNDGMQLTHTGTANDGVGKSQSGGQITILTPGGGSDEPGGNVLIGNFAMFGATGGHTFVQGEAGDRFAVRNSGACAVVEGVGEYACEYMTNGTILNLGHFGTGIGNGMSGGFLYQYDPHGDLEHKASHNDLLLFPITDQTHGSFHAEIVEQLLQWHLEATGSPLAARILSNWDSERENIICGMPKALLLYQDADQILAAKDRKELLEELAQSIAGAKIHEFKEQYRNRDLVLDGRAPGQTPADGTTAADTAQDMFSLIAAYALISISHDIARSRLPRDITSDDPRVEDTVRKLILTEDYFVVAKVVRYLKTRIESFEDRELAALMAAFRIESYQTALDRRNVRATAALGTLGWIGYQRRKNAGLIEGIGIDEALAKAAMSDLVKQASSQVPAVSPSPGSTEPPDASVGAGESDTEASAVAEGAPS